MDWFDDYYGKTISRDMSDGEKQLTGDVYEDFLFEVYQPDYITGTLYSCNAPAPYLTVGKIVERAAITKKYNVPCFMYVQMTGHEQKQDRTVTKEELNLMVNISLTYGAKGIIYFCYGAVGSNETGWWGTAVGQDGSLNDLFYDAQEINRHIATVDEVLMNSIFDGVITTGWSTWAERTQELGVAVSKYDTLSQVKGAHNAIGCFQYDSDKDGQFDSSAYYITNTSNTDKEIMQLIFSQNTSCYFVKNSVKTEYENIENLVVELDAGQGGLLVVKG